MIKNLKVAFFLGYKSIKNGNKGVVVLMILVLSLAFVNLIFVNSLLNGVITTINNQLINNSVANIIIDPQENPTRENYIVHTKELRQQIENIPGVVATVAHYNFLATFAYDKDKNGQFKYGAWPVIGVDPEEELKISGVPKHIIEGNYLEEMGNNNIVLGSDIAGGYGAAEEIKTLGVKVGEKIWLNFSNGTRREYTVQGISKARFTLVDQNAYITTKEAQSILQLSDDRASQILVKIDKTGDEDKYIKQIKEIAPNLKVRKWTEYASILNSVTASFDLVLGMVSAIGLAVAAATIFILIYVNTINKRRQIGILKAIGIKENIIIISYVLQAFFYAILGTIFGAIIMFYFVGPYFISHPIVLPIGDVSLTIKESTVVQGIISLFIAALFAGFVPAWRAAKENILKAIWGE